ncbi:MAG: hypothetical protein MUC66_07900 [Methanolinea sp.]|jgi:DNA-binding transcriptional regulator GbsR (MarR family)|nr:hypothetical protein [Methanolinea sp.]
MDLHEEEDLFIEKISLLFQQYTLLPHVAGRIFGYLLICDPPYQTASQLVDRLSIARSSVSTMMRPLIQTGFVEEFTLPGERSRIYRASEAGWEEQFLKKLAGLSKMRALMEEGKRILKDRPGALSNRIDEMHSMYAFFEREIPILVERWKREKSVVEGIVMKKGHIPVMEDDVL